VLSERGQGVPSPGGRIPPPAGDVIPRVRRRRLGPTLLWWTARRVTCYTLFYFRTVGEKGLDAPGRFMLCRAFTPFREVSYGRKEEGHHRGEGP